MHRVLFRRQALFLQKGRLIRTFAFRECFLRRIAVRRIRILAAFLGVLCVKGFCRRPVGAVRNANRARRGRFSLLRPQHKLRCLREFRIDQGQRYLSEAQRWPLGSPVKNAIGHSLGAQRFVALLAQNPRNRVNDIGLAAAIRANDAGQPAAAEGDLRLFAKRFEAN